MSGVFDRLQKHAVQFHLPGFAKVVQPKLHGFLRSRGMCPVAAKQPVPQGKQIAVVTVGLGPD